MRKGQSLIEVFIAMGVGVLMLSGITSAFSLALRTNEYAEKSRNAAILNDSLVELARSYADGNWSGLYSLPRGSANPYKLVNSGGIITPQSGAETINLNAFDYTRSFYAENVSRDLSDNIESVYNPANEDPSTQKITVKTDYVVFGTSRSLSTSFYATRMRNFIFTQTDWSGGAGQAGPIVSPNSQFFSQTSVDFTTIPGSIMPITNNLINIYVADLDNDRIQKFDENGTFVLKWGTNGSGDGQFQKPYSVAIDSLNNIYVADENNSRVQKFDSNGNFLLKWGTSGSGDGQFGHPLGIAVDASRNIYVVDLDRDRIQKFDSNGNFLMKFGSNGNGDGQFDKPQDVSIDSVGNIYVTEQSNNRVQKFDSNGNFLLKWGSNGNGNGQFSKPLGIRIDNSDNVYIADWGNDRIQKFDSSGNFLLKWGTTGSGNGQFQKPQGITTDQNNNVYIADGDNNRIQKFDSSGNFISKWGTNGSGDGQLSHPRGLEYIPPSCAIGDCVLTSSTFDTQISGGASLDTIMWQGIQPNGTSVKFQIASSNDSAGPWNYTGSDGSGSTYYSPAGPNSQKTIRYGDHNNRRYFRYKIFFDITFGAVPRVDDIILGFTR